MSNQFFNQSMPQTLVIAQLLCYVSAFMGVITGVVTRAVHLPLIGPVGARGIALVIIFGLFLGGLGIANERKWGYAVAIFAAGLQVVMYLKVFGWDVLQFNVLIGFVFDVALFALLLHPQSRNHQRVWFH